MALPEKMVDICIHSNLIPHMYLMILQQHLLYRELEILVLSMVNSFPSVL